MNGPVIEFDEQQCVGFDCPGCGLYHLLPTAADAHPRWSWNGSMERPTLSPSINSWSGDDRCHSFVADGQIQFLSDCTHALAGQTVPLPPLAGTGGRDAQE